MSSSPFPDHYERTRIDGKDHPADIVIGNLASIIKLKRRQSKLSQNLRRTVKEPKAFVAYVDACSEYQSIRENLYFNAGFEHGLLAARQDNLVERMASDPVARRLFVEINQLTLTTELPRNRVAMLLLEAAWAMIYGTAMHDQPSRTGSLELAAIREVLWPGGDMDHEWNSETLEEVAQIARPKKGGG